MMAMGIVNRAILSFISTAVLLRYSAPEGAAAAAASSSWIAELSFSVSLNKKLHIVFHIIVLRMIKREN